MARRIRFIPVFFGLLALLGLAFALFGIWFIALGNEARCWPSVEGKVISTSVRTDVMQSHSASASKESRERRRRYSPSFTYTWTVDGQTYTGSRYQLGTTHEKYKTREEATRAAAKLRGGTAVPVYYDPDDPASAVLDNSTSFGVYVPLPLGLLFLVSGVVGFRHRRAIEKGMANADAQMLDLG